MGPNSVYSFFELTGTIAFACSGAMIAIKNRLDYFGVVVLGITTACGGGMLRDLIIGRTPPSLFTNSTNVVIAFWVVSLLFVCVKFQWHVYFVPLSKAYDDLLDEGFIVTIPGKGSYINLDSVKLVREEKIAKIEKLLSEAIDIAKSLNITKDELLDHYLKLEHKKRGN